jgi:hypothetical protein
MFTKVMKRKNQKLNYWITVLAIHVLNWTKVLPFENSDNMWIGSE